MIINQKEILIDNIIDVDKVILKDRGNNIFLSDEHIEILNKYEINYEICFNINELIFKIEDVLNDSYDELDDLEYLSNLISEYNYYNNTNK
ncbi:MAG: hypothetical protein PHN42_01655 [Bacilli bacterium]|nr:hypothetical protein [Bacilli bacterium]